jgi:hypothetical protein
MANVPMTQKDSIVDQLEELHQRIARRAYDLFLGRDGWGDAFGDWLSAERELVWKPAVELREKDGTEYQNGMLHITVPIAPATRAKRVDVKAA